MGFVVFGLGLAVLFQFVLIRYKWKRKMYMDIVIDIAMLVALNIVFGGSQLGVISATAGSTLISLWLIKFPIKVKLPTLDDDEPESTEHQTDLDRRMDEASRRLEAAMQRMKEL